MHRFSNNAVSTLASGIDNFATTITLAAGGGALFNVPTYADGTIQPATLTHESAPGLSEIVWLVGGGGSDTFVIERSVEGSTPLVWPAGTKVSARVTAGMLGSFLQLNQQGRIVRPGGWPLMQNVYEFAPQGRRTLNSRENVFAFNGRSYGDNVVQISAYPVLQNYPSRNPPFVTSAGALHDQGFSTPSVGGSDFVDLGVPPAWANNAYYYQGSVVVPTGGGTKQFSLQLLDEQNLIFVPLGATEPDFVNGPLSVTDGGEVRGYWTPTDLPIDIQRTFVYRHRLVVTEVGFIASRFSASTPPVVSIGTLAAPTRFANAVSLSQIAARGDVHRIPITAGGASIDNIRFRLDTAATGGRFLGRFYWRGFFTALSQDGE